MSRAADRARIKRIEREGWERDLTAPVDSFSDNLLSGAIYRLQTKVATRDARLYGKVDENVKARLRELIEEKHRRFRMRSA